jgi:hypothetical protein
VVRPDAVPSPCVDAVRLVPWSAYAPAGRAARRPTQDAEQSVLGSMLLNKDAIADCLEP